jgi:hypothetical protein
LPRIAWHVDKKAHDLNTSNVLTRHSPTYADWEIITLFYSAMHHVDATFCQIRSAGTPIPEPRNHMHRRKLIARHLSSIVVDYDVLEGLSRWARYEEVTIVPAYVTEARSLHTSIMNYLRRYVT